MASFDDTKSSGNIQEDELDSRAEDSNYVDMVVDMLATPASATGQQQAPSSETEQQQETMHSSSNEENAKEHIIETKKTGREKPPQDDPLHSSSEVSTSDEEALYDQRGTESGTQTATAATTMGMLEQDIATKQRIQQEDEKQRQRDVEEKRASGHNSVSSLEHAAVSRAQSDESIKETNRRLDGEEGASAIDATTDSDGKQSLTASSSSKNKGATLPGAQRIAPGAETESLPPPTDLRLRLSNSFSGAARETALEYALSGEITDFSGVPATVLESQEEYAQPPTALQPRESDFSSALSSTFSMEDWADEPLTDSESRRSEPVPPPPLPTIASSGRSRSFDSEARSQESVKRSIGGNITEEEEEEDELLAQTGIPAPPGLIPNQRFVQPGAFRLSETSPPYRATHLQPDSADVHVTENEHFDERQETQDEQQDQDLEYARGGLIQATLVSDREIRTGEEQEQNPTNTRDLPMVEAKVFDESGRKKMRMIRILIGLAVLILAGAGVAVALLLVGDKSDNSKGTDSEVEPKGVVETRAIDSFRENLPEATLSDLESESSPQHKAFSWMEGDPNLGSYSLTRQSQRFSLSTFYYATNGQGWMQNDQWLQVESDECGWFSSNAAESELAICEEGSFRVLSLSKNFLSGIIPREIGLLKSLRRILLSDNSLGGFIPPEIGQLENLVEVDLTANALTGPLPEEISQLGVTLEQISLAFNQVNGTIPASWGSLVNLKELHLQATMISGSVPSEVCELVNSGLQLTVNCDRVFCDCGCICVTDGLSTLFDLLPDYTIQALRKQSSPQAQAFEWLRDDPLINEYPTFRLLQRFAMATFYYALDGPYWDVDSGWLEDQHECEWYTDNDDPMCRDDRLVELYFNGNGLEYDIPPEIGFLTDLEYLRLSDDFIEGHIPTTIGHLKNLEELWFDFNNMDGDLPEEIYSLYNLERIDLEDNDHTGNISAKIGDLINLRILRLRNNELVGSIPESVANLVNLTVFHVNGNELTGPLPDFFGDLVYLDTLNLRSNNFYGTIPKSWSNLVYIDDLDISHNSIADNITAEFWEMFTEADTVDIGSNYLNGQLGPEMGLLKELEFLDVYDNNFTGPIPTEFGECLKLEILYLEDNSFTGNIPSEIALLPELELLHVFENSLSGVVPKEICDRTINNGLELAIDCELVTCPEVDCICHCGFPDDSRRLAKEQRKEYLARRRARARQMISWE